ncbi:MAG: hypothetical protein ACLTQI_09000 [Slackia sp.]
MSEATIENEQAEGLDTLNDERARRLVTRMSYIEDGVNPYPSIPKFPTMSSTSTRNTQTLETGRTPKTS